MYFNMIVLVSTQDSRSPFIYKIFDMLDGYKSKQECKLKNLLKELAKFEDYSNTNIQNQSTHGNKLHEFYYLLNSLVQAEIGNTTVFKEELTQGDNTVQISYKKTQDNDQENCEDNRQQLRQAVNVEQKIVKIEQDYIKQEQYLHIDVNACVRHTLKLYNYRHPQYLDHVELYNNENLDQFLKQREVNVKSIVYILKDVAKNLYIYRAYFIEKYSEWQQMASFQELRQKLHQEIQYLQAIYKFQQSNIRQFVSNDTLKLISSLIHLNYYPLLRKIYHNGQQDQQAPIKQENIEQGQYDSYSLSKQNQMIKQEALYQL